VVDFDIRSFFDTVPHAQIMAAVAYHTDNKWILLYVRRWLDAGVHGQDQELQPPGRGTPQGSAISPLLANLFMHVCHECRSGVGV
jgi:RNA-directed DNA polymerase